MSELRQWAETAWDGLGAPPASQHHRKSELKDVVVQPSSLPPPPEEKPWPEGMKDLPRDSQALSIQNEKTPPPTYLLGAAWTNLSRELSVLGQPMGKPTFNHKIIL